MPPVRCQWEGDKEMRKKLAAIASDKGMRKEARGALLYVAQNSVLPRAQANAPVKSGDLRDSGVAGALVSSKKEDLRVKVAFGGGPHQVRYARIIEAKVKFLERAILESARTVGREIADQIDLRRASRA